jgi:hypothetical protein
MQITTVSYQRTYNLGAYNSEKIGLEASIDEGEDIQFAICNLKHECDEIHKKNHPHLYQEQETAFPYNPNNPEYGMPTTTSNMSQPIDNQQLTQEQKINNLINQSTSKVELEQWKLLAHNSKYPSLKEAYTNRLNELTK